MSEKWLTTMKPTFQTEWLTLPPKESHQVLEKIALLTGDPTPDAKVKKQLKYMGGKLHRLRCGNYRIFYTFEHPYVSLLALRRRDNDTYDEDLDAEFLAGFDPNFGNTSSKNLPNWEKIFTAPEPVKTKLPEPITSQLLQNLRIPKICHQRLLQVESREELFDCSGIPDEFILAIDEYLFERPLLEVLQQPDLIATDVDDLLRFKEGNLLGFLLRLNPEQEKYVSWAIDAAGPTLLKGGPGTGKSTVALYRVRALLKTLKATGNPRPRILFTTYTNALIAFSEQLLESLLGNDVQYVEVKTADAIAYSLVYQSTGKPNIASSSELQKLLKQALNTTIDSLEGNALQRLAQAQILERLRVDYLLDEINTVIEARNVKTLADYQSTSRTGRAIALNKVQRQAVWHLRQHFYQLLAKQGLQTWQQVRSHALQLVSLMEKQPVYDAVVIDEAQDLEPNALGLLAQLCASPNRLFVTADANQSIYGSSFRWSDVHQDLKFVGRTGVLRSNHRNTREISEAAHAYLAGGSLDTPEVQDYVNSGPPPAVRTVTSCENEAQLLVRFCRAAAREFRLGIGAGAILVPNESIGQKIAQRLSYLGLEANFMASKKLDLKRQGVKVLTLKAAKGLEFPIVAIAGFLDTSYPPIPKETPEAASVEILHKERRTLYVGMTRAMRALLVVVPAENSSSLLQDFDPQLWNLSNSSAA